MPSLVERPSVQEDVLLAAFHTIVCSSIRRLFRAPFVLGTRLGLDKRVMAVRTGLPLSG